ncbi:uncharacterized protein ACNS7B_019395 [Menidia menidia]|uniref:(Atlantic silverside) hypothetical protein n=1 Tax=Menidia menidia TaxID=238744 RepID=A0A8S4BTS3_9TELE|nr:unnamed protein product [Menidia menidia]
MKTGSSFSHRLLMLISITLVPVLKAEEVTGYVGSEVTLPCPANQGPNFDNVTQVQWDLLGPGGNKTSIIVFNTQHGEHKHESPLKERVKVDRQSLTIKDVGVADAGLYKCVLTTFPSGSSQRITRLVVQEQRPLSTGIVSAIVIAVVLLFVILSATAYLLFIRKHDPAVSFHVQIDTSGQVAGATRPSFIVKEPEVVYADVKHKSSRDGTSSNIKPKDTEQGHEVTYSEVKVVRLQLQRDSVCTHAISSC